MAAAADQLPLDFGGHGSESGIDLRDDRREPRPEVVRLVEYAPFPRVSKDSQQRVGYTRAPLALLSDGGEYDENASGMCLGADHAEAEGSLLRVIVRGVDGRPTLDSIARVVWCLPREDGRFWIGLALVADGRRQMLGVRHTKKSRRIEVMA
jgi:hypothetical protein